MQNDPVEQLFARAKAHGVPMAAICRRAGVAPTTPSRWKNSKNGATTTRIVALHAALSEIIAERPAA